MAGRPRLSTKVLELRGAFKKNPDRALDRVGEPVGHPDVGPPPKEFMNPDSPTALKHLEIWNRFLAEAPPGCITGSDRTRLMNACMLQAKIERGAATTAQHAMMDRYLAGFGMSGPGRAQRGIRGRKNPQAEAEERGGGWAGLARAAKRSHIQ